MTYLSSNQLKQYEDQGYISPIEVLSSSEALEARKEIELIEKKMPNEIDNSGRYNVHLISPNNSHQITIIPNLGHTTNTLSSDVFQTYIESIF